MFNLRFLNFFSSKIWANCSFSSFPLFWWAMWVNRWFPSNQMSDVSESLISLTKMSDHERFAHQKWVNEWIAHFFEQIAHSLIFRQKTSYSLGNQMSEFPALFRTEPISSGCVAWASTELNPNPLAQYSLVLCCSCWLQKLKLTILVRLVVETRLSYL